MSYDVIRSVVDHHASTVAGTPYGFRLKWVAVQQPGEQPCRDTSEAKQLLCVEAIPSRGGLRTPVVLHVLTNVGPVEDLPTLLNDALAQHLTQPRESPFRRSGAPAQ